MAIEEKSVTIDYAAVIAVELKVRSGQIAQAIALFDADNTVPFVARYRKEATGGLDESQLRITLDRLTYLRGLDARRETVLHSIAEQGKLTPELQARLEGAQTLQEVEDLYLPYRPKRRTRATVARERGLEPLAQTMLAQTLEEGDLAEVAAPFLSDELPSPDDVYAGARDIIAEAVAEDADVRAEVRRRTRDEAWVDVAVADPAKDPRGVYQMYYEYSEEMRQTPPHRLLAINRGEREGVLKVRVSAPEERLVEWMAQGQIANPRSIFAPQIRQAVEDGYRRLLAPSIERELRAESTAACDEHAISTFSRNLRQLLLQPPLKGRTVLGVDPGFRTGCKVAVVDATGKHLGGATIYPHEPQRRWDEAKATLHGLLAEHGATVIAIGNGTASRETERLAAEVIAEAADPQGLAYVMVSEAGASVYSASELARAEFPDLDVSMRGAVSIGRRLQDPLAELVKIDPQSIGVGLYQHDVNQKRLAEALDAVVESAVNHVGVDVNTASAPLLGYVSGVSKRVAAAVVAHRDAHGPFRGRDELRKVKGLGEKTYEQAVGFLKIPEAANPLDNTFIHPESYPVVERLFARLGVQGHERDLPRRIEALRSQGDLKELAQALAVGEPTLADILEALARPGRDPREDLPAPLLRQDILSLDDLHEGMVLMGTVRNVVDFGAFVDIGVKQDGLVHISELADRYVRDPFHVVSVGDVVQVRVLKVDGERGRIGLSMKSLPA
ncbi:MAG: RNA-binding transcriptional accessory protein [Chloroflexi bacterium]|nr:RNA-binding transcriptional accessory protein [Chloroflexota bacterium]